MIRLRLSRRLVRRFGLGLALVGVLVGGYFLGDHLTPRDAAGRPLVLSPSIRQAEAYRRAVRRWTVEMAAVDRCLTALLAQGEITDPAQLYDLSDEAQRQVERATNLARDAAFTPAPPALAGLAEQAQVTVGAYLDAALLTARWIGAPEPDGLRQALEGLRAARGLRAGLEAGRWLAGEW